MKQKLRVFLTLLLCAVASVGWAEEVTFTAGTDTGETLVVKDGITVSMSTMSRSDNYRCYANSSMRVHSETVTITKIVITCTASGTSNYGPGQFSLESNSTGSYSYSGNTGTWEGKSNDISLTASAQVRITEIKITYTTASATETCATPTFNPAAGTYVGTQSVTISTTTDGAIIHYTTDGTEPTTNSDVYSSAINVAANTTIMAIAVKEGLDNSAVATATYTILQAVSGYNVDFESELASYVDWTFTNAEKSTGAITAHGGTYYATTGGKTTAVFQTKKKVAYPNVFTCYVSKTSTNTSASTWEIQVSSDGSSWTKVAEKSATNMDKGEWSEFTADIKAAGYTDVYVRLFYRGSTAVRTVDDISLTTYTPAAVEEPIITVAEEFTFSTTATITCVTEGATIYYSFDNVNWTEYTDALTLTATTTIYAKAVKGEDESSVAQATATKVLVTPEVTISATTINIGQTATVSTVGPAVTLSTSDDTIASVEGTTVTGVAEGEATITATWVANSDYSAGTKAFTVIITDPNKPGASAENPYTVAQAIEVINGLENGAMTANEVYVSGTVTQVDEVNTTYHNATYWISNDGGTTKLEVFRGKYLNNTDFVSEDQIIVNDQVVVYGKLQKYVKDDVVTPEIASGNYIVTFNRPQHVVTFSVNGEETTAEVPEGRAIEFPSDPADIYCKTFMGWTDEEINGEQDETPEMVTSATMGTEDVTFFAVFAKKTPGEVTEITDVLTRATTGVTGTSYSSWSGKTLTSSAVYAGNSAGGNDCIQLRTTNSNSGIVTTTSGGKLKEIYVTWGNSTSAGREISIYGSNTAYTAATDLYSSSNQGTLLGTISVDDKNADNTSAVLTVNDDYAFIGIRSSKDALYLSSVSITWEGEGAASYSAYCTTVPVPEPVTINMSSVGYSTLYYGDRNLVVPENMEAYTVKVTTQVERSTTYNAGDVIPAGTGVVLKAAQDSYTFNVSATAGNKDNDNMLRGSDVKALTTGGKYYYALTLNAAKDPDSAGFYWMVDGGGAYEAGAHKAYLALDKTFAELAGNGTAKGYLALPGDETDGIGLIENGQLTMDNAEIYNLSGQRVNKAQKGIYIVNGKKVVIK